ncbi:hypothetical protein NBRC116188_25210 [Oceaniserpentilla sp. 4NH20-0058]|uniref:class I SAM-dependent methyltransferase n=1 Tax=Oceaniserpentilla sp. 4NH20-0058 TaxID=3127660 RepID=UPI003108C7E3
MSFFRVWLKANAADKALATLRYELVELLDDHSCVLDVGCGTGDLLFKAASKIRNGVGVDLDADLIAYAHKQTSCKGVTNLIFEQSDILNITTTNFDVATSTLCIHELDKQKACAVLLHMAHTSKRLLIADYASPKSVLSRIGIELDEMISGHYGQFTRYRRSGRIPAYAQLCGLEVVQAIQSSVDGIVIWELKGKSQHAND